MYMTYSLYIHTHTDIHTYMLCRQGGFAPVFPEGGPAASTSAPRRERKGGIPRDVRGYIYIYIYVHTHV